MTNTAGGPTATITVRANESALAAWLVGALTPEASREVPRARSSLRPLDATSFEVAIEARDLGSLRAALNTYLGWVDLALRTAGAARAPGAGGRPPT